MVATILQLLGLAVVNVGGYLHSPAVGIIATGATVVYVGLAAERV